MSVRFHKRPFRCGNAFETIQWQFAKGRYRFSATTNCDKFTVEAYSERVRCGGMDAGGELNVARVYRGDAESMGEGMKNRMLKTKRTQIR